MMYRAIVLICFLSAALSLRLDLKAQSQSKAPPQKQQEQEDALPVLTVPPGYKYDARGRRDPFVNPIPKPKDEQPVTPVVRPPGLRGVLVSETTIIGIVTSKDPMMNVAVIQAPGSKTYFASRGDALYDAVVKEIQGDAVVFEVAAPGRDRSDRNPPREIVRKLRSTPGD